MCVAVTACQKGQKSIHCGPGPELEAYGSPPYGSVAERLGQCFMPTRKRLKAAGREDLIKLVTKAGGFMQVAQCLGLRSCRRPQGHSRPHLPLMPVHPVKTNRVASMQAQPMTAF